MKKSYNLFAVVLAFMSLVGCSDDLGIETEVNKGQEVAATSELLVTGTINKDAETRVSFADGGTSITPSWEVGDQVFGFYGENTLTYEVASVADGVASFTLVNGAEPTDGTTVHMIYAPGKSVSDLSSQQLAIDLGQQDGTLAGLKNHAIMCATATVSGSALSLQFENQVAIVGVKQFTGLKASTTYTSATFTSAGPTATVKVEGGILKLVTDDAYGTITATGSFASDASGNTTETIYFAVPPTAAVAHSFELNANEDSRVGNISARAIEAGKYYYMSRKAMNSAPINLSAVECANTYMVHSAGTYRFNATVKGNGGLDPMTGTKATTLDPTAISGVKVLWEVGDQYGRAIDYDGTSYSVSYADGYVTFSTPSTFVEGAAGVAVYDSSDNILWSWVIWTTPSINTVTHNGKDFMDRNLCSVNYDYCGSGLLFQWGRKDPFPGARGGAYSPFNYVPSVNSIFTNLSGKSTIAYSILHPTTYITDGNESSWIEQVEYDKGPWRDEVKTIYDPCPAGWRVPTTNEQNGFGGLPGTGFSNEYAEFGNPGSGYYRTSTKTTYPRAYAYRQNGEQNNWASNPAMAIRPVKDSNAPIYTPVTPPTSGTKGSATVTVTDNVNANARTSCGWVQLWAGGPRWAEFNVGASATTYAGMTEYSFENIGGKYSFHGRRNLYDDVDGATSGDTATDLWGTNWRTPTYDELGALFTNCDLSYCDGSIVQYVTGCTLKGWKISGKGEYAGNSIFMPLAGVSDQNAGSGVPYYYNESQRPGNNGWYWSCTPGTGNNGGHIYFGTDRYEVNFHNKPHGDSVRAVLKEQ